MICKPLGAGNLTKNEWEFINRYRKGSNLLPLPKPLAFKTRARRDQSDNKCDGDKGVHFLETKKLRCKLNQ